MSSQRKSPRAGTYERAYRLSVEQLSDTNRSTVVRFLERKANEIKLPTLRLYADWLQRFDAFLNGRSVKDAKSEDVVGFLSGLRHQAYATSVLAQASNSLKAFLRDLAGDAELPRSFLRSFRTTKGSEIPDVPALSDDEVRQLLDAADDIRDKTIIATLATTGFRASELVGLDVDCVRFDGDGTWLRLPREAADLKTGTREVFIAHRFDGTKYLHALKCSLGVVPAGTPLFQSMSRRNQGRRMDAGNLARLVHTIQGRAGTRAVWPHLFRHTAATNDARDGWTEADLRRKYGWSASSKMPSHYVHLNKEDLKRRTLEAAAKATAPNLQRTGGVTASVPASLADALTARASSQAAILDLMRTQAKPAP